MGFGSQTDIPFGACGAGLTAGACDPRRGLLIGRAMAAKRSPKPQDRVRFLVPVPMGHRIVEYRRRRKRKLVELFGGACIRCGYNKSMAALQFHHRNQEEKLFIFSGGGIARPWALVVEEAKKCDLLCANCHAEEHENLIRV